MNFRIDTLGKKIGLGFALITMLLAIAAFITINQINGINRTSERIINLRVPSARKTLEIMNGVNHSVAAFRGYLVYGDKKFLEERRLTWVDEINPYMAEMEEFESNLKDSGFIRRSRNLRNLLDKLEQVQEQTITLVSSNQEQNQNIVNEDIAQLVFQIRDSINIININQEILKQEDFNRIQSQIFVLSNIEWMLLIIGIIISIVLATIITRSLTVPIAESITVADNIGEGDFETQVNIGGSVEIEQLGNALIKMRNSLKSKTEETHRHNWLTSGQNKLSEAIQGDKSIENISQTITAFISEYTSSEIGALYLMNENSTELILTGKYALSDNDEIQKTFKLGEGIIGQVAINKKETEVLDLEEKDIRLKSGTVNAVLKNVLVYPILFEGAVVGVLELGKLQKFDTGIKLFVSSVSESVGIALISAISRRKIQDLLEETQRQSEELQQQQEELQQSNEELEEHTQKLQEQQEELQASNEELEEQSQIVEQKNRDLETATVDIELKAKQLEISSKYKSEFLANMSHELRTPLNSLLILSNDLAKNKEKNLNEDQVESAVVIAKSGYDLLNLINEILDLSKIESGKMDINQSDINLQELANSMHQNFKHMTEQKGLAFKVTLEKNVPEKIHSDNQKVEQILKNLLSNAIKFTEKGSIEVNFYVLNEGQLTISVKDSGIGIPKSKQQIVFEAFQQVDGSTSRKYGGTGLGLSISRELAKILGGHIQLKSEEGKGSEFILTLPYSSGSNEIPTNIISITDEKAIAENSVEINSAKFINYPTIKDDRAELLPEDHVILIIEDDNNFAAVIAKQAREKGFKFVAASTGEDGLLLAEKYLPIAIILDIDLPGINGEIVLKHLKSTPKLRHIPVHIMSVNESTLNIFKSGAIEYLTKPVNREQLDQAFSRMEEFIARKMKNLLVIEDDDNLRKAIVKLIGNGDVKTFEAGNGKESLEILITNKIDCIVLDIGLPDMTGFELIKKLENLGLEIIPPIIIYTGKELSREENNELQQYAETIIVKGVKSEDRLLDETALFLHRTVKNLPKQKQEIISGLYDKDLMFQNKKILLVDDDMRNIFALSKILKESGMEVIKAENGKIALELLQNNPDTDLILMDIMMPEMDGYECMQQIRKNKKYKELPIISLTAKAMKEDRQKCIDAGANDYITKPVNVEQLLSLMRIWINK